MKDKEIASILDEARKAAKEAANKVDDSLPCGFASIKISPARGKLVSYCKKRDIGYHSSYKWTRGWHLPNGVTSQLFDTNRAAASAYAKVLREHFPKLDIQVTSRID